MKQTIEKIPAAESNMRGLYRAAGIGLLITVAFVLLDMAMSFGGGDVATGTWGAVEWFEQFNQNGFLGLRNLGLFNVINITLTIPLYIALYRLHRNSSPALAGLALALYLLGAAVYISNNRALALLALSGQYAAATGVEKDLLAAAGTAILAHAEDFTPGTFTGFFFSSTASLMMMAAMLRGSVFSKRISLLGLAGSGALLIFTILVTFAPQTFDTAMLLAMVGGLMMLAWNVLMAQRMLRLCRSEANVSVRNVSPVLP